MGKALSSFDSSLPSDLLSRSILPSCALLTSCQLHSGSLLEVRRLYERFRRGKYRGYHVTSGEFRLLMHHSPVDGLEDVYGVFGRTGDRLVNVLEVLTALVVVSTAGVRDKVMFLVRLFDFDNNKCITIDEMTILCTSAVNGLCCLFGHPRLPISILKRLSAYVFQSADLHPDGLVTYNELLLWTQSQQDLVDFMQKYALGQSEEPDLVFLYMHEVQEKHENRRQKEKLRSMKTERNRSNSIKNKPNSSQNRSNSIKNQATNVTFPHIKTSISSHSPTLLIRGKRVNKEDVLQLKKLFDRLDVEKTGKVTEEQFRNSMENRPNLKAFAKSIFHSYDSQAAGTFTFQEMLLKTFRGARPSDISTMTHWIHGISHLDREQERYLRVNPTQITRSSKRKITINTAMQYKRLFDLYDRNKDGALDYEELKMGLGGVFSPEDISQMLQEYDSTHDHRIYLLDFIRLMAPKNAVLVPEAMASLSGN